MAIVPIETAEKIALAKLTEYFEGILKNVGEDPAREGLLKTPERAAKAMQFLTQGYTQDAEAILRSAMFQEEYSEMVIVKDIELYSMCEHHMLPFFWQSTCGIYSKWVYCGLE